MIPFLFPILTLVSTPMIPNPAQSGSAAMDPPKVMIEMRLLQIDAPAATGAPIIADIPVLGRLFRKSADPQDPAKAPLIEPGEAATQEKTSRSDKTNRQRFDGSLNMAVVTNDWELKIGALVLEARGGEITPVAGVADGAQPWRWIAAPRLIVFVGQAATLSVGRAIPYMAQRRDGSLVLESDEDFFEGVHFSALVDNIDEDTVSIKQLRLKIGKLVGRVAIEGVPFEVGRPIVQTIETSMALRLKPEQTAVISLPRDDRDQAPILMILRTRRVIEER